MRGCKKVKDEQVMVWAGIYNDKVIGPYFFPATVNQHTYLEMLGDYLIPQLHGFGINPQEIWFQQDGAPPHWAKTVRHWLDENMPNWIGRGGVKQWAPRSPDLTPLDFFLWGYVKHLVYQTQPQSIDELKQRIENAFAEITVETLKKVHEDMLYRCKLCIHLKGGHIEHYKE